MHFLLILESSKIYIKIYINIAPTCFGLRPSLRSLNVSLAKVTLTLKQSVKYVVMCYAVVWQHAATLLTETCRRNFNINFNVKIRAF
jgi:hypothetical protein